MVLPEIFGARGGSANAELSKRRREDAALLRCLRAPDSESTHQVLTSLSVMKYWSKRKGHSWPSNLFCPLGSPLVSGKLPPELFWRNFSPSSW